jgi:hypothetical protein
MKKLLYILLLPLAAALFGSCEKTEELVFDQEKPQFELRDSAILVEVIMPQGTTADDKLYIVGAFNGGEDVAVDNLQWQLEKSPQSDHKWGIYLYPSLFEPGKTLADGFYFVSASQGKERTLDNEDILHTETAIAGERVDVKAVRWEAYFNPPPAWPAVPSGKIMVKLTVPDYTPLNSMIALYGNVNDWDGSDHIKWGSVMLDKTHYYIVVDPADFAAGKTLADEFKVAVICPAPAVASQDQWWYHQANADGSDAEMKGFTIEEAVAGMSYSLDVAGWAKSAVMVDAPWSPSNIITLNITAPDYTPLNATIVLRGEINNWDAADPKWTATMTSKTSYRMELDPNDFETGKTIADNFTLDLLIDGFAAWTFQANKDGSDAIGAFFKGTTNSVEVLNWRNKDLIPLPDGITIRWRQPGNEWAAMAVYAWGGSPNSNPFGSWPGETVTPDAEGWYSVTLPEGQSVGSVIFNNANGGAQFDAPQVANETGTYEITGSACTRLDKVIKWKQPGNEWTAMAVYAWGGSPSSDPFGSWPGAVVTADASGWFRVVVLYGQTVGSVIFNNGNGGAGNQFDASEVIDNSGCYEITDSSCSVISCD